MTDDQKKTVPAAPVTTDRNEQKAADSTRDPLDVDMPYAATEEGGELDPQGNLVESSEKES